MFFVFAPGTTLWHDESQLLVVNPVPEGRGSFADSDAALPSSRCSLSLRFTVYVTSRTNSSPNPSPTPSQSDTINQCMGLVVPVSYTGSVRRPQCPLCGEICCR